MAILQRIKSMSRLKKLVLSVVILVGAYTVTGFLILPPILKWVLSKKLSENLHRQTTIQDIDLNPYALSFSMKGFTVKEPEGTEPFVSLDGLYVNLQAMSIIKRALLVRELRLERPYCKVARHEENRYNFSDLMGGQGGGEKEEKESGLFLFSLNNIQLTNGAVRVWDGPKGKEHNITDINIGIPLISNLPYHVDTFVEPLFAARFNETAVSLEGRTKPFEESRQTILDVDFKDIDIPYYLAYAPTKLNFKMPKGFLDIKGTVSYTSNPSGQPALVLAGDLSVRTVEILDEEDRSVLKLPLLAVSIPSAEPLAKKIHLSKVLVQSPEVHVRRDEAGSLNLPALLPAKETETSEPETEKAGQPLFLTVDETRIAEGKIFFSDLSASSPFETTLSPVELTVRQFSNDEGKRATFDFSLLTEANEALKLGGEFSVNPLLAEATVGLQGVSVKKYGPYVPEQVQISVTDGKLATDGRLSLSSSHEGGITSTYKGQLALSDLACVDKVQTKDLVKWKSLRMDSLDMGFNPSYINIGEIFLESLFANLIVQPDKRLNLQTLVADKKKEEAPPAPEAGEGKTIQSVNIQKVALKGGRIHFLDRSIQPSYAAKLTGIEGAVTGLTSMESKPAQVLLKGKLDDRAPLDIKGRISPLQENLFVDLKVSFNNIELSPMTPYSGRYVGYTIGKGKLTVNLEYLIDKNKLTSQNRFRVDQLTFGDAVSSPEATTLPVKLGVALLKNREGVIDLDVPVSGSLNDPEFRVGKIILKAIGNLLVKAATSPFALLGAVMGGGEELSVVEFDYGSSAILPESQKKLDTLIGALYERPALKLEIEGHVDMEQDKEGLKKYLFESKLQAHKLKEMIKKGSPPVPVAEVKIEPHEYEEYLEKAYKAEKFEKPKNFLGMAKKLPVTEMERLIQEHIEAGDDDLRLLALERARAVEGYLLQPEKIEASRVFITEPKSLAPEQKEGVKNSRVDLRLQ